MYIFNVCLDYFSKKKRLSDKHNTKDLLPPSYFNAWIESNRCSPGATRPTLYLTLVFELTLLIGFGWWTTRRERKAETARSGQCLTSQFQMSSDSESLLGRLKLNSLSVILSRFFILFSLPSLHGLLTLNLAWSAVICLMSLQQCNDLFMSKINTR